MVMVAEIDENQALPRICESLQCHIPFSNSFKFIHSSKEKHEFIVKLGHQCVIVND